MKKTLIMLAVMLTMIGFTSCNDDENGNEPKKQVSLAQRTYEMNEETDPNETSINIKVRQNISFIDDKNGIILTYSECKMLDDVYTITTENISKFTYTYDGEKGVLEMGECNITLNGVLHHYDDTDETLTFMLSADEQELKSESYTLRQTRFNPPTWKDPSSSIGSVQKEFELNESTIQGIWQGDSIGNILRIEFIANEISVIKHMGPLFLKYEIIKDQPYELNGNTIKAGDYTITMTPNKVTYWPDSSDYLYEAEVEITKDGEVVIPKMLVTKFDF